MSVLSEAEISVAKSRAISHLQRSVLGICISLGLDPDSVDSSLSIPVEDSDPSYYAYVSLIAQLSALEKIS